MLDYEDQLREKEFEEVIPSEDELEEVHDRHILSDKPERTFADFDYRTLKSWSRSRRVVAKAEHLRGGPNPRFVVTSFGEEDWEARDLYEKLYCARGDMENRIKEQQLGLFADRTSTHHLRSNQMRLYFSSAVRPVRSVPMVSGARSATMGLSTPLLTSAPCAMRTSASFSSSEEAEMKESTKIAPKISQLQLRKQF